MVPGDRFSTRLLRALGWVWEAPQSLLGAGLGGLLLAVGRVQQVEIVSGRVVFRTRDLGISLGHFCFYGEEGSRYFPPDPLMRQHELGHTFQSRWLGPLYLPLVGVPSVARAAYALMYREWSGHTWSGYFSGWPEDSADRLGGIPRAQREAQLRASNSLDRHA